MSTQTDECDLEPRGMCVCEGVGAHIVDSSCYSVTPHTHKHRYCTHTQRLAEEEEEENSR